MNARRIVLGALAALPLLAAAFVGVQYRSVSHPKVDPQPLPEGLIAHDSPEGRALLASAAAKADADALIAAWQPQEQQHWAGVATTTTVLSALRGEHRAQADFFTPQTGAVRHWFWITFTGMTLDDLGGMFVAHGADAAVHHADEGLAAFRAELAHNLATPGDWLVVNYARKSLGQGSSGNIAPVAAWDEASDRVLVLDAAAFKWPAVWVPADALFAAMDTIDTEVDARRGWVVVKPAAAGAAAR